MIHRRWRDSECKKERCLELQDASAKLFEAEMAVREGGTAEGLLGAF